MGSGDLITDQAQDLITQITVGLEATVACGVNNDEHNHTQEILITSADDWQQAWGNQPANQQPAQTPGGNQMAGRSIGSVPDVNQTPCVIVCVTVCVCVCAHSQNRPLSEIHQVLHSYRPRPDNDPATSKSFVLVK